MTLSGAVDNTAVKNIKFVLIPLLVDDPLWVSPERFKHERCVVLIPLLVDDPLWVERVRL